VLRQQPSPKNNQRKTAGRKLEKRKRSAEVKTAVMHFGARGTRVTVRGHEKFWEALSNLADQKSHPQVNKD